jgi:urease accessory protein UreH
LLGRKWKEVIEGHRKHLAPALTFKPKTFRLGKKVIITGLSIGAGISKGDKLNISQNFESGCVLLIRVIGEAVPL